MPLNKEDCRKLIIDIGIDFLNLINSDQEVKPYLYKYPFESKDISINLFFRDKKNNFAEFPNISVADFSSDYLSYEIQKVDYDKKLLIRF